MASIKKKALYGNNKNQIRSPTVKRSPSSSVILQGWLYKQGSDGLMLWKKRWFVLADYCLFYYKGPAEEKLLGSCLLASYKISPCTSDDKIYRKFSFKAEHANMRTYYFSAESQASMIQWINALSLASICQENQSDNLEIGKIESWVVSEHQPLYANAPPKPRRVVESPELTPKRMGPENLNGEDPNYLNYQIRGSIPLNNPPSNIPSYSHLRPTNQVAYANNHVPMKYEQNYFVYQAPPINRSKTNDPSRFPPPQPTILNNYGVRVHPGQHERDPAQMKKFPPRPHSADFLEHDMKESKQIFYQTESSKFNDVAKLQRPKSSLDVIRYNDYSYDSLHWSEEAYAEKMRQTSLYVTPHFRSHDKNNVPNVKGKDAGFHQNVDNRQSYKQVDPRYDYSYGEGSSFNRSASARFPLQSKPENSYSGSEGSSSKIKKDSLDKDVKTSTSEEREESMRRLLVWKQRMLQSPLTRKSSSGSAIQAQIASKIESGSFHKKFTSKDDTSDHSNNSTIGTSSNQNSESYSDKLPFRRKSLTKENPKFHYHSLSSDEDDVSRTYEGRKHNHKSLYSKKSAVQSDNNLISSSSTEHSDNSVSRINRGMNIKYPSPLTAIPGTSRTDTHPTSQQSHFEPPICDDISLPQFEMSTSEGVTKSAIPVCHEYKNSVDSSCNMESQSPICSKPSDSGYSTLQNGILLKNNRSNSLDLTQCDGNYSYDSNTETDTAQDMKKEWGLKLDESRVIKEFSYHYINAQKEDSKRPLWSVDEENSIANSAKEITQSEMELSSGKDTENIKSNSVKDLSLNIFTFKCSNIKNDSLNGDLTDNVGDISTFCQGNNDNLHNSHKTKEPSAEHESIRKTSGPTLEKYYSNTSSTNSHSNNKNVDKNSTDFSREILFPNVPPDSNSCNTVSSDEDRDDEVAAVLGKHKKIGYNSHSVDNSNSGVSGEMENAETSNTNVNVFSALTPENIGEKIKEEHYMPMTPKKKMISSPDNESAYVSRNASASSFYGTESNDNILEESSYVEMSHNSTSSSNNGIRAFKPSGVGSVTPGSSDLQLFEDNPDYEYISKDNISEPVYVELSSSFRDKKSEHLKSKFSSKDLTSSNSNKDHLYYSSLKHSLPDILNTSSPQCTRSSTKSDSSDADDEASKDLDCITTPTHPRFSLSDTFRPASYYLGTNHSAGTLIGLNLEQQDSSDSDLVSPPPIPVSTPPVDELDLSLDLVKRCNLSSPKDDKTGYLNDQSCNYWKTLPDPGHKPKKLCNRYLTSRPIEDLSSETDSVDSFRKEQMLKRRPVSADLLDNLSESNFLSSSPSSRRKSVGSDVESIGFSNSEDRIVNCDHFLEDLQVNDQFLESLVKNSTDNITNLLQIDPSLEKQSSIDSRFKINNVIWEYEKKKNDNSSENVSDGVYEKYFKHKVSTNQQVMRISTATHNETVSVNSQSGAPYYYSDILKSGGGGGGVDQNTMAIDPINPNQSSSSPPLNNNNKLRKMKNNMVNPNYGSKKDNYSRQCSPKKCSSNNLLEGIKTANTNLNPSNLNETKGSSIKLLSRSLTPDFHIKKRTSASHNNKHNAKISNSVISLGEAPENNSLRRSRSFDGLLDDTEQTEEKPRVLRASPSNAIFKLLQTTQGTSQEYSEKTFPSNSFIRKKQVSSVSQTDQIKQIPDKNYDTSLRLAKSLDNLEWYSEGPSVRKSYVAPGRSVDSSPGPHLIRDVNDMLNVDIKMTSNNHLSSTRMDDIRNTSSLCDSAGILEYSSTKGIERTSSGVIIGPSTKPLQDSAYECEHEKHNQWDPVSSSSRGMIVRTQEKPPQKGPHHPSLLVSSGISVSSSGIVSSPNTSSIPTASSGDGWNLELSAGELLGRTHEELVLLLIQLRRRSSGLCKAIDDFQKEINSKMKLIEQDPSKRIEGSMKKEELKRHLSDLEKQYEKGKPLVNLVDNMVKLGSLYHSNMNSQFNTVPQRREFNHKVQEQRLLAEEKKEWERLYPDQKQLQEKVKQLYKLDQILQKESSTLQSLQQDKAALEQALGGLRQKLDAMHGNPVETEQCRHQQRMLEKGLTRVRSILAQNSKKLEETVAENARLEQELVILRQKLQFSRRAVEPGSTTAALESELKRVQDLVGDLQRQRQDLCFQVHQLTEKSNSLSQQIQPLSYEIPNTSNSSPKRRATSSWVETDLDSQITQEVGIEYSSQQSSHMMPLFNMCGDPNKKICIIHKEKPQEIKTVRIVKRESERRQRDRERNGTLGIPLINMISRRETIAEESPGSSSLNEMTIPQSILDNCGMSVEDSWSVPPINSNPPPLNPRTDSVDAVKNFVIKHKQLKDDVLVSKAPSVDSGQVESYHSSEELAPVYLSKAAQEIVQEVAWRKKGEKRLIPKEKRRYHTVSGQSLFQEFTAFSSVGSRDDLDMERALRNRVHTPDVVRSTLSRDAKFTAETIDNILGTPSKIVIPERYIPESEPQVSKEEQLQRSRKADAIRKMLTQSSTITPETADAHRDAGFNSAQYKDKIAEEKQQREHLLQLNQILAQQVIEKSKIVAVTALASALEKESSSDTDDTSPDEPLPLYQQRENYFS